MPRPGTKPPTKRVNEITTEITLKMWEQHGSVGTLHERDTLMINELIKELAICRAIIEVYELPK